MAVRAITKAEVVDGCKIGVILSMGDQSSEAAFLRLVADHMAAEMRLRLGRVGAGWLFILADGSPHPPPDLTASVSTGKGSKPPPNVIFILGATEELVQPRRAPYVLQIYPDFSDFLGLDERTFWTGLVRNLGDSIYDEAALWDVVRKAARKPIDPLLPPPGSVSIDQMLAGARAKLQRVTPNQAYRELQANGAALGAPVILVDIRPQAQREKHGGIKGALCIERNVLEWRLDPRSDARLPVADRYDLVVIVVCQEGYTSSLAAYSLQQLGLLNATDIIGGYEAWRLAGLPVDTPEEVILASQGRDQRSLASRAGSVV
ncbi:Rhodanese-like domain-containing protein [Ephemerocybe angulata]|uniref:Rhodanese-like domain-containing protein n=1 Tax=Ephemerocybe angulata TaxID=980116 RepID=A0A8H6HF00_9AGAR|nr:Rhodanese-like domain-containing protein [Tulosesus angulatus]